MAALRRIAVAGDVGGGGGGVDDLYRLDTVLVQEPPALSESNGVTLRGPDTGETRTRTGEQLELNRHEVLGDDVKARLRQ